MTLIDLFQEVRQYTEKLCTPLQNEDYISQRSVFASPPKWHLGHVTWFFEVFILCNYDKEYIPFKKGYEFLFNSYYNAMGERIKRNERGLLTRPTVDEIYQYRSYVDKHIVELLENSHDSKLEELITLGLNHEQQHQELLLTDLKHTFAVNPTHPVYKNDFDFTERSHSDSCDITVDEGIYEVGYNGNAFHYDNEKGRHKVYLHQFEINDQLITNEEYLCFINNGGYSTASLWLDDGWTWVQQNKINSPDYWLHDGSSWKTYTLSGLQEVNPISPVCHVSFYEADAFARWKGMRLPTEFEWEIASNKFQWGKRWEWTNSAYLPYPGFTIPEGAVGEYNGKFMINQMVLRGASDVTSPNHSRNTYRNFFYPEQRWQYTGIRLVK